MSATAAKEMEAIKEDVPNDAKDDVGVNKSESNEGENTENDGNTQETAIDEKDTESQEPDAEEEGDRHVVLTPSRRLRIF